MSGFGSMPFGRGPYGIGTAPLADPLGGSVLRNETTGETEGSRRLNPATRDYDVDANGRVLGENNVRALVELAIATERGSSAMAELGHALKSIKRIGTSFEYRVRTTVTAAVKHLTDRRIIALIGTSVENIAPGKTVIRIDWRDLSTGEVQFSEV